jgi:hypothetical protein
LALFENQNSSCENIWTPLTDEQVEGLFKNIETGTLASYLPWQSGSPSGLEKKNNVIMDLASKSYIDRLGIVPNTCNACNLSVTTTFSLNGVCKNTYISKNIHFHLTNNIFIIKDSLYWLKNKNGRLQFGSMHTSIW